MMVLCVEQRVEIILLMYNIILYVHYKIFMTMQGARINARFETQSYGLFLTCRGKLMIKIA
jgi:hypothetical protein